MTETRTLTFAGARGDQLDGRLDLPDGKPRAVVLVAHCFSGGNAGPAAAQIAREHEPRCPVCGCAHLHVNSSRRLLARLTGKS